MMSLNLFSQTDTIQSTKVILPETIARKVVQDLIRLDSYKEENKKLFRLVGMYENKIEYLEDINLNLEQQNLTQKSIMSLQTSQLEVKTRQTEVYKSKYKSEKRKKTLYLILGIVSTVSLSTLLITN